MKIFFKYSPKAIQAQNVFVVSRVALGEHAIFASFYLAQSVGLSVSAYLKHVFNAVSLIISDIIVGIFSMQASIKSFSAFI